MNDKLNQIVNNEKLFESMQKYVRDGISILKMLDEYKDEFKALEKSIKTDLGLTKAEFKAVIKFVIDKDNKLNQEINKLSSISSLVTKLK